MVSYFEDCLFRVSLDSETVIMSLGNRTDLFVAGEYFWLCCSNSFYL